MGILTLNISEQENRRPNSSGYLNFVLAFNADHVFTLANFTTETTPPYGDPEGDDLEAVQITEIPVKGTLKLNGAPVVQMDIVTEADLIAGNLVYESDDTITDGYSDSWMQFLVSDKGSHLFTSRRFDIAFIVEGNVNEAPNSVGDGEADIVVGSTTIFTRAMLTSMLNPPYEDPEGDIADNLLVEVVPTYGDLFLNGVLVVADQIIPFTDIDSGLLVYINTAIDLGGDEKFSFKISDVGSGEYRG